MPHPTVANMAPLASAPPPTVHRRGPARPPHNQPRPAASATRATGALRPAASPGYSLRADGALSVFADGEPFVWVEYKFTPDSGEVFWVVFDCLTVHVRTS